MPKGNSDSDKPQVDDQTRQIMERLLKTPPDPKTKKQDTKPTKRTTGKGRARVGKAKS